MRTLATGWGFAGIYKNKDNIVTVIIRDNKLCVTDNFDTSLSEMELYYSGNDTFFTKETPYPLQFIGTGSQFDSFVLFCSDGTKMLDENNQIVEFKRVK